MVIGLLSGAGPLSGIELMTHIIKLCQERGAFRDRDFPEMHLINFPFSEMLEGDIDAAQITQEIEYGFDKLKDCNHIMAVCQTLHLFLPPKQPVGFISLFDCVKEVLPLDRKPIVIASRTSVKNKLHDTLLKMECEYYDAEKSQAVIDAILRGEYVDLCWINALDQERPIILGCTEYSVSQQVVFNPNVIDPLKVAARKLVDSFFMS